MGEIVSLRQTRKREAKAAAEDLAAANRLAFGRSKEERRRLKAEREAQAKRLEGHRLDKPAGNGD
ncbi:MAG TPA: DUF4169 family protein [Roseiarcus sp.]|nr:DUF4169 family protein [Roseiarcus sp.]